MGEYKYVNSMLDVQLRSASLRTELCMEIRHVPATSWWHCDERSGSCAAAEKRFRWLYPVHDSGDSDEGVANQSSKCRSNDSATASNSMQQKHAQVAKASKGLQHASLIRVWRRRPEGPVTVRNRTPP